MDNYENYQKKVQGENINPQTLIATDYLNHFNEVHMLIDMLPSMPDCIEDIQEWNPKTYQEHFSESVFNAKDLAIEAYKYSPEKFRKPFEQTVDHMNELVLNTIVLVEQALDNNSTGALQDIINDYSPKMIKLIEDCSSIINGEKQMTHQDNIDHYFDDNVEKLEGEDLDQSSIDDLFG